MKSIKTIWIVSGEGEQGTREQYSGKLTARALKLRLTRERRGGDRWARIEVQIDGACARVGSAEDALRVIKAGWL